MLISARLLKITPVVSVGGVQGDVCVTATGEKLKASHVPDMSARKPDPGDRGPFNKE